MLAGELTRQRIDAAHALDGDQERFVVVEAAGGRVLTEDGAPLRYGKRERGYDNPHFIVYGDVTPLSA